MKFRYKLALQLNRLACKIWPGMMKYLEAVEFMEYAKQFGVAGIDYNFAKENLKNVNRSYIPHQITTKG